MSTLSTSPCIEPSPVPQLEKAKSDTKVDEKGMQYQLYLSMPLSDSPSKVSLKIAQLIGREGENSHVRGVNPHLLCLLAVLFLDWLFTDCLIEVLIGKSSLSFS